MNANRNRIAVSTITAALAAVAVSFPASADDHREHRRGERPVMDERSAPPAARVRHADFPPYARSQHVQQHDVYREHPESPIMHQRPVIVHRPIVVERPVYVQRNVIVEQPAPVYDHEPRPTYAYAPAPGYYDRPAAYQEDERNQAGAIAGAVIGGVIGAILGGILGSGF